MPMGSKRPAFKGRAILLTRELCNIRVKAAKDQTTTPKFIQLHRVCKISRR